MDHMDDDAIIDGLARGDQKAFRELVERYKRKVFYLALDMAGNPVDAEDISQEVFLKVFRSFSTFRRGAQLGSWLYRITYNASIDHLRRKGATPEPVGDEVLESLSRVEAGLPPRGAADPGAGLEASQLQERIVRALDKDLKLKDIAAALDLSIGSVKSYLFRAVRKLQKELGPAALISGAESSHE
jgi:RNA polymerase sigma-70 factor (ECF subfamily)